MLPFQKSLLLRIVVSFSLLSSLIVILMTVFSYSFFISGTEQRAMEQMQGLAAIKVEMLDQWAEEQRKDVLSLSSFTEVRRDAAVLCSKDEGSEDFTRARRRLYGFFLSQTESYPEFKDISILSAQGGKVVFSTNRSLEGQYRVLDAFYVEGKKGIHIENVYPSPVTLQPTMTVSTPLGEKSDAPVAVLAVDLDLDTMDRIIQDKTGLGGTGEAYLVDRFNVFVSSERFGRESYPRGVHSVGIDAAVSGESGAGLYRNYSGIPVIGVYRWIPERNLALIVEISREEAFRPAWNQTVILVTIGLVTTIAAAVGGFLIARKIATPILAVQHAALRVSGGDLSAQAPVLTGDEIGELAKSFNDMTVKVKNLYDELKRNGEHFRSIIESSTDIIAVFDERPVISFISPSVGRILGFDPGELVGTDPTLLVHPEDLPAVRGETERLIASGEPPITPLVFRAVHKRGGWRTLEATGKNLILHPAIAGIVLTARDITDRQVLEDRLLQAQKMEAVGRLAGGIAHDFNNLLTAVLGYSDVLLEESGLDEESRGHVVEIKKAANRAASLTQQLLAFSRKQMLQPKTVDLNALVTNMQNMLKRIIGEDVELLTRLSPLQSSVRADPSQIEQVVMNLAINARDAMPDGGKIVFEIANVDIGADSFGRYPELSQGSYVILTVIDTGVGMDADTRKRIFEPFFTTKGIGKGTGLGLSTVYGIIKQSGGHITVHSEVGRGSTFRIYLPAAPKGGAEPENASLRREVLSGTETVLVVEDEESVRRMIDIVLGQGGYVVHSEAAPADAIRYAEATDAIDLLVTDVVLPGMNGKNLAETLIGRHPELKVLYISGYTEDAIVQHGVLSEGIAFLQKPFLPRSLAAKVREILDGR